MCLDAHSTQSDLGVFSYVNTAKEIHWSPHKKGTLHTNYHRKHLHKKIKINKKSEDKQKSHVKCMLSLANSI